MFSLSDDACCEFLEELRFRLALNDLALFSDEELFEAELLFSADWWALLDVSASVLELPLSLVSAKAEPGRVRLTWLSHEITATVYRMKSGDADWQAVGQATADGPGMLSYEDTQVAAETRYGYKLSTGAGEFSQEVWVVVPTGQFALRSRPRAVK